MKFLTEIDIMPRKELLDPQGKAVTHGLHNIGLTQLDNVRVGKHITYEVEAENENAAREQAENACKKLLANLVMEGYHINISAI
jgi:phosphoribosylformylglycinamidine synthase PurS subunit